MEKYEPLNKFFKNTRRHRRFVVDRMDIRITAMTAFGKSASAEDYRVIMLSLAGMQIESGHHLELKSKLQMEMTLPENVRISLTGRVTCCVAEEDDKGLRHNIGIEFIEMSEQDRTELKKFIHWLYLKDAGFTE
jgi:c-di-GMP-binding flagellar brake protein YcgR